MSDTSGRNLIFIVSQPRSGSTLLQRILGSHPDIHTLSEPWLMIQPLYGLNDRHRAPESLKPNWKALRSFIDALPGQQDDYIEGVRRMYAYLYEQALSGTGKRFFLDKTPRYYSIIPELARVFPEARFIILFRQPLAVCASILDRFERGEARPHRSRPDLLDAPGLLLEGVELLGRRGLAVHYESLAQEPEREVRRVCDWLGIDFRPEMIEYGGSTELPKWQMGDPRVVYENTRPVATHLDGWAGRLDSAQNWRALRDYLHLLGEDTVTRMGYSYEELERTLDSHKPSAPALARTTSLEGMLSQAAQRQSPVRRLLRRLLPGGG